MALTQADLDRLALNIAGAQSWVEDDETSSGTDANGNNFKTIRKINNEAELALAAQALLPPITYAGGIAFLVSETTKTVEEAGNVYAPLPSALPFTTSGTFIGDDDARFYTVQNGSAAGISATPTAPLIGTTVQEQLTEIGASLQAINTGIITTVITVSDAAWTPNALTKSIKFTVVGPGGGGGGIGGGGAGTAATAAGGSSGATAKLTTSTIDATYSITIGVAGTGGAAGNNDGVAGTDTTIVSATVNITAGGGGRGRGMTGTSSFANGNPGGNAVATGGDLNIRGNAADAGLVQGGFQIRISAGAISSLGGGYLGSSGYNGNDGADAIDYGNGGNGADGRDDAVDYAGGDGFQGVVIIEEYL